ncbi:MAG: Rab family GTPase [Candidatus Helarchaeota archaeon]
MNEDIDEKYTLKIVLVGDYAVGKTSLIQQFIEKSFRRDYRPTLGADISLFDIELEAKHEKTQVRLMLWDIAGQHQWHTVRKRYYQGSHGIILIYDITRAPTFYNIEGKWLDELEEYCYKTAEQKPPIILAGNKVDLKDIAKISAEKGDKLKNKYDNIIEHIQTSARTGENVKEAFIRLARMVIDTKDE